MFGYVTINENELKIRDFHRYRAFYCGLCQSLRRRYGIKGQLTLPYDMTFVDILLNSMYEKPLTESERFCLTHPLKKQHMLNNEITDYTADMALLLVYYKLRDDVADDRSVKAGIGSSLFKRHIEPIKAAWPRQAEAVSTYVREQNAYEAKGEYDIDAAAAFSGKMLGELFVLTEDEWSDELRQMGFYLGKFVYLMDAFDDLDKDLKKGSYNPWKPYCEDVDFDARVENILTMMMAECAKQFERLPIVQDADILRNIIYSGVWMKYVQIRKKKDESSGK
ncbi:MAG: DUF5685 family protein [Lachnospiraceae bacterium]|nr:DUF5685 family protein [Lachnospiraceae bacterium]